MLGTNVVRDLELTELSSVVPTKLKSGAACFTEQLTHPSSDRNGIRGRQRVLKALRRGAGAKISPILQTLSEPAAVVDGWSIEASGGGAKLAEESICQIFYKRDSPGSFLNSNTRYLDFVLFWRTILLPAFALLAPIIGVILPFFLFKYLGAEMAVPEYIEHVRTVILRQISIPNVLRPRGDGDRLGGALQSLFVGFTLVMFISGLWNQIQAAIHLRSVYGSLSDRGVAIRSLYEGAGSILEVLKADKYAAVYGPLIDEGAAALSEAAAYAEKPAIACAGLYWNGTPFDRLLAWLGLVDAHVAVSSLSEICFPRICANGPTRLRLRGVRHPLLKGCVANDFGSTGHVILTGPNRGGKSTFCKSLGIAVICAQSWGFAWADAMEITPFAAIHSALETVGRLGHNSTFEAEIDFAKNVLDVSSAPLFVMMDEIFHSTNAVDGVAASKVFLERLYNKTGCVSLISTHYRELATAFSKSATALQMITTGDEDALVYSYKVGAGTSDKSSVMELLREKGLLVPGAAEGAKKPSQPNQNE